MSRRFQDASKEAVVAVHIGSMLWRVLELFNSAPQTVQDGLAPVRRSLTDKLRELGFTLRAYEAGTKFDPTRMRTLLDGPAPALVSKTLAPGFDRHGVVVERALVE